MIIVVIDDPSFCREVVWTGPENRVRRIHNLIIRRLALDVIAGGRPKRSGIYKAWQEPPISEVGNGAYTRKKG